MEKVAFHTLGCKVNQYETEAMEELFENKGYEIVDVEEGADVYVINTCTVTNMSDRKSRQFIRRAKRSNPDAIVAVVGCYSQTSPEEVGAIEGVDVIIGTSNRARIVDLCEESKRESRLINIVDQVVDNKEFEEISIDSLDDMTRAYIKIQDGCNQFCSYCIIPYARGPIRSRQLEDVLDEVSRLGARGYREIVLTGIHVASYGLDLSPRIGLKDLVRQLAQIDSIERIRFSSIEPGIIDDDFMQVLMDSQKACHHFHLSLQSGSDTVLERMNRKYSSQDFREKTDIIRRYMPDAGLTTDIIVGFPGETEEEFLETYEFAREIGFSKLHVFKYSKREGTPAAEMEGQVDGLIQAERSERLIGLGDALEEDFNRKFLGREMEVLFEYGSSTDDGFMEGYSSNYIRVRSKFDKSAQGKIKSVIIRDIDGDMLIADLID